MAWEAPLKQESIVGGPEARYHVQRVLGSGGMGEVCLAEDTELHRLVAIKTIRQDLCANELVRRRIERECLMHARVGAHPNIVTLFDKIEEGDSIYLVMEYAAGELLQDRLVRCTDEGGAIDVNEALSIAEQCLDALTRIHQNDIVHRDIKPSNILLAWDESRGLTPKLMDFGIAYLDDKEVEVSRLTHSGGVGPGTPLYMAPEQIDSQRYGPVTAAADIYAMGVLLYEMLAGQPPFMGSFTEIFNAHLNSPVPPVQVRRNPALSRRMARLLERALAKEPSERYASAAAFRVAVLEHLDPGRITPFTAAAAGLPGPAPVAAPATPPGVELHELETVPQTPDPASLPAPPRTWRRRLPLAAALVVAVAGAAAIAQLWPRVSGEATVGTDAVVRPSAVQEIAPEAVLVQPQGETLEVFLDSEEDVPVVPEAGAEEEGGGTYLVQAGDTLTEIADRFGIDGEELARWNQIRQPSQLAAGTVLLLYEPSDLPDLGPIEVDAVPAQAEPRPRAPEPAAAAAPPASPPRAAEREDVTERPQPKIQRRGSQVRRLGPPSD